MKLTTQKLVSCLLLFVFAFGFANNADAQKRKKDKKKKKEQEEQTVKIDPRIINSDRSEVCQVFADGIEETNEELARISQNFADMNLRRQVKDYGPGFQSEDGQYSAWYYWKKMYQDAPGFSILVYTDGSAIFREMAAKAQEEGDEAKFEEYSRRSLELLEEGEKCYPETKGMFGPAKAYIYELLEPNQYEKIFALYTEGFGPKTDPYSLISITRYSQYMGYIGKITTEEAQDWLAKTRAVANAFPDSNDYKYALETIDAVEEQYADLYKEKEEYERQKAEAANASATATQQQQAAAAGTNLYNEMISAFESGDLTTANNKFNEYMATLEDATRKYQIAMYAAGSFYQVNDYPKARSAYQKAAAADPSQGDPYYFIGLMYLSSGELCGPGVGFDSQRVIWPAFDKFMVAKSKTLSPGYADDINSTMASYKQYLPSDAQLTEQGLSKGSTYTVPCWINESTTVRSNTTQSF